MISIWAVLFINLWKHKQSTLQFEWDTTNYVKSLETIRPEFEQMVKNKNKNLITGVNKGEIKNWIRSNIIQCNFIIRLKNLLLQIKRRRSNTWPRFSPFYLW